MTAKKIMGWKLLEILCLILVPMLLVSCSALSELAGEASIRHPQVSFTGAKITGLSFDAADLLFDVKIRNPNAVGLKMAGFSYDFVINESSFLKGNQDRGLAIEASGESVVQLPLSLNYMNLYQTFQGIRDQDLSTYQMNFGFAFDLPVLGRVNIPVSKSGDFPLLKMPKIEIDMLRLKSLSLSGAELLLRVKLDNPNAFSMLLSKLQYDFEVNQQKWVSGYAEEHAQIAEKGEGYIDIPVSLDLLQMGRSVYQLLSGNEDISYQFGGKVDLATSLPLLGEVSLPFDRSGSIRLIR